MKFNKKIFVKKFLLIIAVASILMCSTVSASAVSIQSYIPDCNLGAIGTPYASVAASFPLASYPEGSYYSTTGSACSCHNWCSWSSSCTCKKYDSSSQCAAFAKYIFYTAKGYDMVQMPTRVVDPNRNYALIFDGCAFSLGNINDIPVDIKSQFETKDYINAKITINNLRIIYDEDFAGTICCGEIKQVEAI